MNRNHKMWRAVGLAIAGIWVLASASGAFGVPISSGMAVYLAPDTVYTGPAGPTPGQWDVSTAVNGGTIENEIGTPGNAWTVYAGAFTWSGHDLVNDQSTQMDPDSWLADGVFGGGGMLTLSGTVYDLSWNVIYTGDLLTATVGDFQLRETDKDSDSISSIGSIYMTTTGGWLATNSDLQVNGIYEFALVGANFGPTAGGPLDDFQEDSKLLNGYQVTFKYYVPEPTSVLMLGAAGMWMVLRRHGRAPRF